MVNFAREVGIVLLRRLEDYLDLLSNASFHARTCQTHLGAIGELVRGKIDLAKAALPYKPAQRIAPHGLQIICREFTRYTHQRGVLGGIDTESSYSRSCLYESASYPSKVSARQYRAESAQEAGPFVKGRDGDDGAYFLPLGLHFSLSPGIRLHGSRRSKVPLREAS